MQHSSERVRLDPSVHEIVGTTHNTYYSGQTRDAQRVLAQNAINLALAVPVESLNLSLDDPVMTRELDVAARDAGFHAAEVAATNQHITALDSSLRPPGAYTPDPSKVTPLQEEMVKAGDTLTYLQAELDALVLAKPPGQPTTEYEMYLVGQIGQTKTYHNTLQAELAKLRAEVAPKSDPFSRRITKQKRQELRGGVTTGREAFSYEVRTGGKLNPKVWADGLRAARGVRAAQGSTPSQQRAEDKGRAAQGLPPIHEATRHTSLWDSAKRRVGLETPAQRNHSKSRETSYNKIARVGNVLVVEGRPFFVRDIIPEKAVFTLPNGSEEDLFYLDEKGKKAGPVLMDDQDDVLLNGPGTKPKMCIAQSVPDPAGGSPTIKLVEVDPKQAKPNIHKGEEMVVLGPLFTEEEAKDILTGEIDPSTGETSKEILSTQSRRLDDLIFDATVISEEEERQSILEDLLTWQYAVDGSPESDPRVPILDGHDGHFVRPFSYRDHRKNTYRVQRDKAVYDASLSRRHGEVTGKGPEGSSQERRRTRRTLSNPLRSRIT